MSTSAERTRQILSDSTFFGSLPGDTLDALIKRGRVARYARKDVIYQRGDAGDSLMVILTGRVKVTNITSDAREVVLNFLGPCDVIGEIAILDGRERTANAAALEDTEAFVVYRRDLLPALLASPEAMLEIIQALCEKLRGASSMIEHNALEMQGRFASGLLRLANQHGRVTKDGIRIDLQINQSDLGNYLALSRENASRQLGKLKDRGLIRFDGAQILILDEPGLRALAEGPAG